MVTGGGGGRGRGGKGNCRWSHLNFGMGALFNGHVIIRASMAGIFVSKAFFIKNNNRAAGILNWLTKNIGNGLSCCCG